MTEGNKWVHSIKNSLWVTYDRLSTPNSTGEQPLIILSNSTEDGDDRQKRSVTQTQLTEEEEVKF